jgi:hypothetical protein
MDNIEEIEDSSRGKVSIALPVRAEYYVIEDLLRKKLIGEKVKAEKNGKTSTYAEILDVVLEKSPEEEYDLVLELKVRALTSLLKNKEGRLLINVSLQFNKEDQVITINDYKLEGNTRNWLLNNFLETVANIFMYNKLKEKMRFDFLPNIQEQLETINKKLQNRVEPHQGIFVSGDLKSIKIRNIVPQEKYLLVEVNIEGMANVEIEKINL